MFCLAIMVTHPKVIETNPNRSEIMKVLSKKSLFALAAVSVIAVSSTGYAATMNGTKSSQEATLAMNSKASLHQAMNLAKQKVAGDIISAEFDGDNQGEYEVKLIQGNQKYEVKINAATGEIIKTKQESMDKKDLAEVAAWRQSKIQLNQAISIAQQTTAGQVMGAEFDFKYGKGIYEMKVAKQGQKHKLDIDANTGAVLKNRPSH